MAPCTSRWVQLSCGQMLMQASAAGPMAWLSLCAATVPQPDGADHGHGSAGNGHGSNGSSDNKNGGRGGGGGHGSNGNGASTTLAVDRHHQARATIVPPSPWLPHRQSARVDNASTPVAGRQGSLVGRGTSRRRCDAWPSPRCAGAGEHGGGPPPRSPAARQRAGGLAGAARAGRGRKGKEEGGRWLCAARAAAPPSAQQRMCLRHVPMHCAGGTTHPVAWKRSPVFSRVRHPPMLSCRRAPRAVQRGAPRPLRSTRGPAPPAASAKPCTPMRRRRARGSARRTAAGGEGRAAAVMARR